MLTSRSFVCSCLFVGLLAFLESSHEPQAFAQRPTDCGCPDVNELINRLNMAEAAVSRLKQEIPKIEADDRRDGKTSFFTDLAPDGRRTNKEVVADAIDKTIKDVQARGARTSTADTSASCKPRLVTSSTPCMNEIVMFHENVVHVTACERDQANGNTSLLGNRIQTTVDYAKEEMAGYLAEIDRIKQILKSLPDSCRPSGWFGMIYYYEKATLETHATLPPSGVRTSGSEDSSSIVVREVRILYRESGTSRMTLQVVDDNSKTTAVSGRISCTGSLRGAPTQSSSSKVEEITHADVITDGDAEVSFDFDEQSGEFSLGFEIMEATAAGEFKQTIQGQGECNAADNGTKTSGATVALFHAKTGVSVNGKATRNADRIEGARDLETGVPVSMPGGSAIRTASVRWTFYRVD